MRAYDKVVCIVNFETLIYFWMIGILLTLDIQLNNALGIVNPLPDMNSFVLIVLGWDPDVFSVDNICTGISFNAPWMSSISAHTLRSSWCDFAIAHQVAGIVVPHQLYLLRTIILEHHWNHHRSTH